ncbi:MAG: hypothetical protein HY660_15855 [Armatimonadetes bacterium]|nr:hypothetical protein [Armatimonadota bacterium]
MTTFRLVAVLVGLALLMAQAVPVLAGFEGGDSPNYGPTGAANSNNQGRANPDATSKADPPNEPNQAATDHRQ